MMNLSRRTFLKSSALAVAGTGVLTQTLMAAKAKGQVVALQLYSVRDDMQKDLLGTLKAVTQMGYTNVEHANYVNRKFYGYTAKEFKKVLKDNGLKMVSGHTVLGKNHWDAAKKDFTDAWKYTVEDAGVLEQEYIISPWMDESLYQDYDTFSGFMDVTNKCGELCQKSGMKFGYHNHDFEFSKKLNGVLVFDMIMQKIDPTKVVLQLDIGNMYIAGAKAADIVNKYPGRFENIHVKDMIKSEKEESGFESSILGKGLVNTKDVIDLSKAKGGTRVFIVEQESYQNMTAQQSVKEDLAIMKKWGY
jgi:sugar phosphate isomerase/epimerase